uniref:PPPDE domain-containing protein n=1 Tax=Oryza punctata TaxID=4537 RepID=A0A0E0L8M0_ORYPU
MAPASSSSTSASTPRAPRQQLPRGASAAASSSSSSPVYLNVYDVTPANGYARWLGLGVYHSGVQGISWGGVRVRGARRGGERDLRGGAEEVPRVRAVMADLAEEFPGDAYNLVSRNCNHFCDAACRRLVRARIPRWVNRLAKIGVVFTCVIPGNGAAVRRKGDPPATAAGRKASIRSRSARQGADAAAPPRPKTFFRSLSVGGGGGGGSKNVTPRPLSTLPSPSPTPSAPPAFTSAT